MKSVNENCLLHLFINEYPSFILLTPHSFKWGHHTRGDLKVWTMKTRQIRTASHQRTPKSKAGRNETIHVEQLYSFNYKNNSCFKFNFTPWLIWRFAKHTLSCSMTLAVSTMTLLASLVFLRLMNTMPPSQQAMPTVPAHSSSFLAIVVQRSGKTSIRPAWGKRTGN